jgi:hypothetical protein
MFATAIQLHRALRHPQHQSVDDRTLQGVMQGAAALAAVSCGNGRLPC